MEYEEVYLWQRLLSMYFLYSIMNNRKSFWSGTFYLRSEKVRGWEGIVHPALCKIKGCYVRFRLHVFAFCPSVFWGKKTETSCTFQSQYKLFHIKETDETLLKRKTGACNEDCKNNFSWGMSQKWHVWKWRRTEEATASLWSSVKLFMVRWCHPDFDWDALFE